MTTTPAASADPQLTHDQIGRRLALRLGAASILFWWVLGIPFSWATLLLNGPQRHSLLFSCGWGIPVLGWTGVVLLPWWRWRRLTTRLASGDPAAGSAIERFPVEVGILIFVTSCLLYLLGAAQLALTAASPPLESIKLLLQGASFGLLFAVAGALRVEEELGLRGVFRRRMVVIVSSLVIGVAVPLILLGLTRQQAMLERERGEMLLHALEEGVRNGTPLPDLSSFGDATVARVVERATGVIQLGPASGAVIDSLKLDETGMIMTGRAGWSVNRSAGHQVVARLPIALPNDPGVILLAVSPLGDYATPIWSFAALAGAMLLVALGVVIPVARRLGRSLGPS